MLALGLGWPLWSMAASQTLERIEITGNIKTRPLTILRELPFEPGDAIDSEDIDQATQAVKDLGLFERVEIKTSSTSDGKVVAVIEVKEKRFNFILPKINRNGDGDITTGIVWRSDNLFGRNQQSKFTYSYRKFDDADEDEETEIKWEFTYPRIMDTPYSMEFVVLDEDTNLEETIDGRTGEYERQRRLGRLLIGRWINQEGPSQGLNFRIGPSLESYEHTYVSGDTGVLPDELDVYSVMGRLDGFYVHDNLLSRSGHHYRYELAVGNDTTGSDIDFHRHFFFYRKYMPIGDLDHQNLNLQFRAGYINESILGPPQYKIGGSTGIRGYDRDAIEGNMFAIINMEYLRPFSGYDTLRGVFFLDVGDAWLDSDDVSLSDLKVGTGFGLRWKLKRFVRTDVRLDIARGLTDEGETKAYLSTRATF